MTTPVLNKHIKNSASKQNSHIEPIPSSYIT
jgi:hypothetical protein